MDENSELNIDEFNFDEIDNVCRICLTSENKLHFIFDGLQLNENISLASMITECCDCVVRKDDQHPKKICIVCIEELTVAYNFRKQCQKSYKFVSIHIDNGKILFDPIIKIEMESNQKDNFTQTDVSTIYPCEKCDEKFLTMEELITHRQYNHKGSQHECRVCNKSFRRIGYLKNHLAICHPEFGFSNSTQCQICEKIFGRPAHLRRHLIKIHNKKFVLGQIVENDDHNDQYNELSQQHFCSTCSTEYKTQEDLNNHICNSTNEILNIEPILDNFENNIDGDTCELPAPDTQTEDGDEDTIPLVFLKNETLPTKSTKETTTSEFAAETPAKLTPLKYLKKCQTCQKSFRRASHLRRHERTHLNLKPFSCEHCSKSFSRIEHLNIHASKAHSEMHEYICEICSRGFPRKENLERHNKKCAIENQKALQKAKKTFICSVCNKGFTTEKYFKIHVKSHGMKIWSCKFCPMVHNSKSESKEHSKTHQENQKPYLCSECGLRFVRNDYLIVHMRRHKGEKPYKCKFCDKGFPRATDLTVHERYHTGEKTHLCVVCGKGFQRAYNLVVHMRVHTGERPYKCPHCTKCFAQGNDLKAHIRRHTGERFRCEICNEGFIQGYHLTQHKRNSHGIDMPSHIRRVEKIAPRPQTRIEELMIQMVDENDENDMEEAKSPKSENYEEESIDNPYYDELILQQDDGLDDNEEVLNFDNGATVTILNDKNTTNICGPIFFSTEPLFKTP